jgi:hypothetical protein
VSYWDEKIWDETLLENVQCCQLLKLKMTKVWQLMVVNDKSCEFSIFVLFCFFAGYELIGVLMIDIV